MKVYRGIQDLEYRFCGLNLSFTEK